MRHLAVAGLLIALGVGLSALGQSQSQSQPTRPAASPNGQDPDDILNAPMTPPRSDGKTAPQPEPNEDASGTYSSSKDSPSLPEPSPSNADHTGGEIEILPADGVTEMKNWNPHEADKDVEVGLFYFKRNNYRAAEARFRHALTWQDNHAEATYRLALVLEKEGKHAEASQDYEKYLKILPHGEFAAESKKALERLSGTNEGQKKADKKKTTSPPS
jgi:tetratricopeptide (TPR) repeat protein